MSYQNSDLTFPLIQLIPLLFQMGSESLQKVQEPLPLFWLVDILGAIHGLAAGAADAQQFSITAIVLPILQAGFADLRVIRYIDDAVHINERHLRMVFQRAVHLNQRDTEIASPVAHDIEIKGSSVGVEEKSPFKFRGIHAGVENLVAVAVLHNFVKNFPQTLFLCLAVNRVIFWCLRFFGK